MVRELGEFKGVTTIDTYVEEIPNLNTLKNLETLIIKPYDHSEFRGYVSEINGLENLKNLKELDNRD